MRMSSSLAAMGRYLQELFSFVTGWGQAGGRGFNSRRTILSKCFLPAVRSGRIRAAELRLDALELAAELQDVQLGAHPGVELHPVDRLGEELGDPVLHPLEARVLIVARGEEDDRDAAA